MQLHACALLSQEASRDLRAALASDLTGTGQVDWLHPDLWRLQLVGFGHVTRSDAVQLVDTLRDRVSELVVPTLRLNRVQALIYDGDDSVWAGLAGDTDDLAEIASSITRWVHELGFVPDRRIYRPWVRLGRINANTDLAYLESLEDRLGAYQGPVWTVEHVTLARTRAATPQRPAILDVFDQAALIRHDASTTLRTTA
jgi:2'-5' RNA ligase